MKTTAMILPAFALLFPIPIKAQPVVSISVAASVEKDPLQNLLMFGDPLLPGETLFVLSIIGVLIIIGFFVLIRILRGGGG